MGGAVAADAKTHVLALAPITVERAALLVEVLRAKRVPGGEAAFALMFGAARVSRLLGIPRETFVRVAGILWDTSCDDSEHQKQTPPPKTG